MRHPNLRGTCTKALLGLRSACFGIGAAVLALTVFSGVYYPNLIAARASAWSDGAFDFGTDNQLVDSSACPR